MKRYFFHFTSFLILMAIICFSGSRYAQADVFIAPAIKTLPKAINFSLRKGEWKNAKLFGKSNMAEKTDTAISFSETAGYYGFAVLICNEENTTLYLEGKPADCTRHQINSSKDTVRFQTDGKASYHILIHNTTEPLSVNRNIRIQYITTVVWNEEAQAHIKDVLNASMNTLQTRHDIAPYNIGIAPCQNNYIPSSLKSRTLTLCSEYAISPENDFSYPSALGYLFYEAAPFLHEEMALPAFETEEDRVNFALTMLVLLSDDSQPLQDIYHWHQENKPSLVMMAPVIQMAHPGFDVDQQLLYIENYYTNTDDQMREGIDQLYATMNDATLESIRDGNLIHYSAIRNSARLIINDRFLKDRENKPAHEKSGREKLLDFADEIF